MSAGPVAQMVGRNIRRVRKIHTGLTLEDVSAECGICVSTLSKIELGDRAIGVDDLVGIARALGVKPGMLLDSNCLALT